MPIIGIVSRLYHSQENHRIDIIYSDIIKSVYQAGGIPIGIFLNENYKQTISICDGIILQGGDFSSDYELDLIKYCYDFSVPIFGICLGMQLMGYVFNGKIIDIKNHKKKLNYAHSIKLSKTSKLYNILKGDIVKVNSRHLQVLQKTNLSISSISQDGYIESIEDKNKKFFIGVQWHPESMTSFDEKQNNLFKNFIKVCENKC